MITKDQLLAVATEPDLFPATVRQIATKVRSRYGPISQDRVRGMLWALHDAGRLYVYPNGWVTHVLAEGTVEGGWTGWQRGLAVYPWRPAWLDQEAIQR